MASTQSSIVIQQAMTYVRMIDFGTTGQKPSMVVNLSKAGAAFVANTGGNGAITEIANGWYSVQLSSGDTSTLGDLAWHITAGSGGPMDFADQIQSQVFQQLILDNTNRASPASNIRQNATGTLNFTMTSSTTNQPLIGLTGITAQRAFGSGAFSNCVNTPVEVGGTNNGAGNYSIALAQTDTNAPCITYRFTASGANDVNIHILTSP